MHLELTGFERAYLTAWSIAVLAASVLMIVRRGRFVLFRKRYWLFLAQTWKIVTFSIALGAFVILAPYTGDPTWDWFDAAFMSILTYVTAPWAVGTFYRAARRNAAWTETCVAVCCWLFSASWSYDLYQLLRTGYYPITWQANLAASSVLYISAGLFWNLEHRPGRGVVLAFMSEQWPDTAVVPSFKKILWYALPFMILAAAIFVPFLF